MSNKNLRAAQDSKIDEFYTTRETVEAELPYYADCFRGKVVYCNCDTEDSEFFRFFLRNFESYGIKRLIATHYNKNGEKSYLIDATSSTEWMGRYLPCNGDFRSAPCIDLLKESDIVCTNPPFSLFRDFFLELMAYDKKFLILGNLNAIKYKGVFPRLRDGKVWFGRSIREGGAKFFVPDYYPPKGNSGCDTNRQSFVRSCNIRWYTNLGVPYYPPPLNLSENKYEGRESVYPKYDNCDAIEVSKTKNMPCDYNGYMGVPITFFDKFNPEQFEILRYLDPRLDGREKYTRLIVKRKK